MAFPSISQLGLFRAGPGLPALPALRRLGAPLFAAGVLLAGGASATYLVMQSGDARVASFVILLFFACATASLKVRLPGVERSISLSLLFSFASITELPAGHALFIVAVALLYESLGVDVRVSPRWGEIGLNLASAAVATVCASGVYEQSNQVGLKPPLSLLAAALTYFGVTSVTNATQIALRSGERPWKVWNERFFWVAPLYFLAAVAVGITKALFTPASTSQRLWTLVLIFLAYRYVKYYFARLHDREDSARRMEVIRLRAIEALAVAIEAKDGATAGHLERVRRHGLRLAKRLKLSEAEIKTLELAAILHDVGKVGIPDHILGKSGRLTDQEFSRLALHTTLGAQIVAGVQFPYPVDEVVLSHHEHWDGSGYPRRLSGTRIPKLARVLTVVDCFDALVSDRPYRPALPLPRAAELMREQRGKIFDPEILDAFLEELPAFAEDLVCELHAERARLGAERVLPVRQSWLTDADFNEAAMRQLAVEKLVSTPERLVTLYEVLQTLGGDFDVQQNLKQTLTTLQRAVPYEKGAIFVLEGSGYRLLQAEGLPPHSVAGLSLPALCGTFAAAAAARKPLIVEGPGLELEDGRTPRYFEDVRSTLAAPLIVDENVVGAVALCSSRPGNFDVDQSWFLSLITGKLASAVISSRILREVCREAATGPATDLRAASRRLE